MTVNSVVAKVAKATIEIGNFIADKRNNEQNYNYISADQVLDRSGITLAKNGVIVLPAITSQEIKLTEIKDKKPRFDATVTFDMLVTDGESEYHAAWTGSGCDYGIADKSLYKAITSGHKYFLMKLLNISVGNSDSEHEGDEQQSQKAPAPVQRIQATDPTGLPAIDTEGKPIFEGLAPGVKKYTVKEVYHGKNKDGSKDLLKVVTAEQEYGGKYGVTCFHPPACYKNFAEWPIDTRYKPHAEASFVLIAAATGDKKFPDVVGFSGQEPADPFDDDPTYGSHMPDPRTGDGDNLG